jgi:hypothetical protein
MKGFHLNGGPGNGSLFGGGGTAIVLEFHDGHINDFSKNRFARFIMVDLVAPLPSELLAVIPAILAPVEPPIETKRKGGRRSDPDDAAIAEVMRILRQREATTLLAAVERMQGDKKVNVKGEKNTAIYERIRRKLKNTHHITETSEGVVLVPKIPENSTIE